jgi:hypothetical protein
MFQIVHDHSLSEVWHIVRETEKTPPLFFYLNWAAIRLGDPTEWIRAPAVLFGTALIPVVYGLGLRTVGRVAGVVAAAIVTLDPFAIFYGTEARPYGALACLGALSTLCLLEALDTNRRRWWAAYGLTVVGVAYTHYMGIFVLLVQVLWAFWVHRDRVAELVIVHALVVIAYVPWISSYVLQQQHSGDEATRVAALSPPSFARFADIDVRLVLGHPFFPLSEIPGRVPVAIALAVIAVALAVAVRLAGAGPRAPVLAPAVDRPARSGVAGRRGSREPAPAHELPADAQLRRLAARRGAHHRLAADAAAPSRSGGGGRRDPGRPGHRGRPGVTARPPALGLP